MPELRLSYAQRSAAVLLSFVLHACGSTESASTGSLETSGGSSARNATEEAGGVVAAAPKAAQDAKDAPLAGKPAGAGAGAPTPAGAAAPSGKPKPDAGSMVPSPMQPATPPDTEADAGVTSDDRDQRWDEPYVGKYTDDSKWLCRPGLPNNPCDAPQKITDFQPDGSKKVSELPATPADVGVDCFYTYPTVDTGLLAAPRNLDFPQIDKDPVLDVMSSQALPFRPLCRIYAPVYRQASLVSFTEGDKTREAGLEYGYADVADAFDYFLRNSDSTRPLVLLSHSQGSMVMLRLIARRIQDDPKLRKRLVVAVLAGPLGGFNVPQGKLVGGSLKDIPLCSSQLQTGCALTYASFVDKIPPNADYAKIGGGIPTGYDTGCTNPPAYSGDAIRSAGALFLTRYRQTALSVQLNVSVDTEYARYGGFYTAQCKSSKQNLGYLEIAVAPQAGDMRKNPVPFDALALSDASIGLHALDYAFIAAELFDAVNAKIEAYHRAVP